MGFIANLAKSGGSVSVARKVGNEDSRARWRRVFGVSKEDPRPGKPEATPSGYRSSVGSQPNIAQLLRAMRSLAPGGWSDNKFEQSNHFTGIAYVAIHRICEQMMQAEFQVLERDPRHPKGMREVGCDHPLVNLLEHPNNDETFGDLMYKWVQQMGLTGTALTWLVPNRMGTPCEMYPIPTALCIPQSTMTPEYPDGYYRVQPIYPYGPFSTYPSPQTAAGALIPGQWMLRFQYPHPILRYDGYSPLSALRLHFDEVEAIDRSRWYAQRRSVSPSAVLNFDGDNAEPLPEQEIARIHAEFENEQMGPENAGRLFIASPGAKLEQWGSSPKEMEYQQSWEQLVGFCHAGFGITKEAAGMLANSSYSTLFATLKQLHLLTLVPLCQRIASKLTRHLASYFGGNLLVRIRAPRIDDHDIRNAALNVLITARAITKNELREQLGGNLGIDPTREEWGTEIAGDQRQLGMPETAQQPQQGQQQGGGGNVENGPAGTGAFTAAAGLTGPQNSPPAPPKLGEEEAKEAEAPVPPEIEATRPIPQKLGRGALGPRKSLAVALNGRK